MLDRKTLALVAGIASTLALAASCTVAGSRSADTGQLTRGQYLVTIMACGDCHTPGALAGSRDPSRPLAGSEVGFGLGPGRGVVYPKNLTPDRDTGLGAWTDDEIVRAIRQGVARDGRPLIPVMPWPSYAVLTPEDARAIVAYLRTIPAVKHQVPADVKPGASPTKPFLAVTDPGAK
jgi:mono/diheme cytochrome c family protein